MHEDGEPDTTKLQEVDEAMQIRDSDWAKGSERKSVSGGMNELRHRREHVVTKELVAHGARENDEGRIAEEERAAEEESYLAN